MGTPGGQKYINNLVCVWCRYLDLQTFAEEARLEGAVVLNVVQAEVGENGLLQSFLEDADVQTAHTGSDALATKLCHDKVRLCNAIPGQGYVACAALEAGCISLDTSSCQRYVHAMLEPTSSS